MVNGKRAPRAEGPGGKVMCEERSENFRDYLHQL